MHALEWLAASPLGVLIRESYWVYPIVLSFHAIGMAIVVGVVLTFDLRVLGYAKGIPLSWFDQLFTFAWIGFGLNAVSGAMLFAGEPVKFTFSTAFQLKIALIAAGSISMWFLRRSTHEVGQMSEHGVASKTMQIAAAISLILWMGAITAGRMIAYTT